MKRSVLLFVCLAGALLCAQRAEAQVPDTMDVPFGTFEEWDLYPADSLSVMGGMIKLPVNYDHELPRGWSVPVYVVDDTFTYSGMEVPLNVSLPLAVTYADSVNAPEGRKALVARTFLFSEVMTPTAMSLAEGLLDSTLTQMLLPTILTTGQVNLTNLLPLVQQLTFNTTELSWMLDLMDTADMNDYLTGGFALNGFKPGKLEGKFIYRDPGHGSDDDNGAVIMIGTRYDTAQHRRVLVGAGVKRLYELGDSVHYVPFDLEYTSLSSYFPQSYGYYDADTMVVMVISSASGKFQHGSRLFVDELRLVSRPNPCGQVTNLHVVKNAPMNVQIAWNNTLAPDSWEVEYGPAGFVRGLGTTMTVTDSTAYFYWMEVNSQYDIYVRGLCGDTAETEWVFMTLETAHVGIEEAQGEGIRLMPNPAAGRCVLDLGNEEASRVRLYAADGRLVRELTVRGEREVELTLPCAGVYVVEVSQAAGRACKRLIAK